MFTFQLELGVDYVPDVTRGANVTQEGDLDDHGWPRDYYMGDVLECHWDCAEEVSSKV